MTESIIIEIEIDQLLPDPSQPRKTFDEDSINALSEDIRINGLKEPLDINPLLDGRTTKYIIIDGECRFHAIKEIDDFGLIPCNLYTYKSQRDIDRHRASKHFHRKDWNPADRAEWLKYYIVTHKLRQQDLAREFNIKQSAVSEWLAPTRDAELLKALRKREIGFKQAVLLSRIDDAETRENALSEAIGKTKRETEEIIARAIITPEIDEIPQGTEEDALTVDEEEDETNLGMEEAVSETSSSSETAGIVAQTLGIAINVERENGTEENPSDVLSDDSEPQSPPLEGGITPDVPPSETEKATEPPIVRKIEKQYETVKKLSHDPRKLTSDLSMANQKTVIRTARRTGEGYLCLSAKLRCATIGESYELARLIATRPWVVGLTVGDISENEIENAKSSLIDMKKTIEENLNLLVKRSG